MNVKHLDSKVYFILINGESFNDTDHIGFTTTEYRFKIHLILFLNIRRYNLIVIDKESTYYRYLKLSSKLDDNEIGYKILFKKYNIALNFCMETTGIHLADLTNADQNSNILDVGY